jgi:hypothetical protein
MSSKENAGFYPDLKSVEKVAKQCMWQKLSTKKWWKNGVFDFYERVQKFLAYTLWGENFCDFLQIQNQYRILSMLNFCKQDLWVLL